jgi:hypothetical protein
MATSTKPAEPVVLTVNEAQAALTAALQEAAETRAAAGGNTLPIWKERASIHTTADRTMRRAERTVVESVLTSTPVDPLTQLLARQELPRAEQRVADPEVALARARAMAATAARAAHERVVHEAETLLRKDLPGRMRQLRRMQASWNELRTRLEALDAQLGRPMFTE